MKKTIVIKVGRNIATTKRNKLDLYRFEQLAKQISTLQGQGMHTVLVVSAAVSCGEKELGLKNQYEFSKELISSVGQATVMANLYEVFRKHGLKMGQLLLTKQELENEQKRKTVKLVLQQAADQNIVLVTNENDVVELHSFGGNDHLSAEIAKLISAEHLLLLTDVYGIMNEKMKVIKIYKKQSIGRVRKKLFKGEVGGIYGKLNAAIQAADSGINTWIMHGRTKNLLIRLFLENEHIGTRVIGRSI